MGNSQPQKTYRKLGLVRTIIFVGLVCLLSVFANGFEQADAVLFEYSPNQNTNNFILFEDFGWMYWEGATINGNNGWTASESVKGIYGTGHPYNGALSIRGKDEWAYLPLGDVEITDKGTLFFRMSHGGSADIFAGLSAESTPVNLNSFAVQIGSRPDQLGNFAIRDGATFLKGADATPLDNRTWQCIWIQVDAESNSFQVYASGGLHNSPSLVSAEGKTTFSFRNSTSDPLSTFMLWTGDNDGYFNIDDIYVDTTGHSVENPTDFNCQNGSLDKSRTLEDFELLSNGPIDGRRGWIATSGAVVTTDPHNAFNQVLKVAGNDQWANKILPDDIEASSIGTVSFLLKREGNVDAFAGLSNEVHPTSFADFEIQFGSNGSATDKFTLRDGSSFKQPANQFDATSTSEDWNCITITLDNDANSYSVYKKTAAGEQEQLTFAGDDSFEFRNGANDPLKSFFMRSGVNQGSFYIDDIYYSNSWQEPSFYPAHKCADYEPFNPPEEVSFEAMETFEELDIGQIPGTQSWFSSRGVTVQLDPADSTNKVLQLVGSDQIISRSGRFKVGGENGSTLFFRMRKSGAANGSVGLSDFWWPAAKNDYQSRISVDPTNPDGLTILNRDTVEVIDDVLLDDQWYCVWVTYFNGRERKTYSVQLQGGQFDTPIDLVPSYGIGFPREVHTFESLFLTTGPNHIGTLYFDDFYKQEGLQNIQENPGGDCLFSEPQNTPTPTATETATPVATETLTAEPPASSTPESTATPLPTNTTTPSPTPTAIPSETQTVTPSPTDSPANPQSLPVKIYFPIGVLDG